jgi:hypothetical protein
LPDIPGTPTPASERLLLKRNPVLWSTWVDVWERDRADETVPPLLDVDLLSARAARPREIAAADAAP